MLLFDGMEYLINYILFDLKMVANENLIIKVVDLLFYIENMAD